MSFEAESNSELTMIVPAYQLHFRFLVQNKIHKQQILSDTRTGILGSIAGPCDFLPARSDEFQKVCCDVHNYIITPFPATYFVHTSFYSTPLCHTLLRASMVYVLLGSVENKIMVILEYNNEVECV